MEIATGVFRSRSDAERVVNELRDSGVPQEQIGLITPDSQSAQGNTRVPVTDTEEPGMGRAMGATVGGAVGAASGATLGLAAASLVVPGVGPLLAFGLVGGAVLGLVGAAAGSAIGDQVEETLGEGVPHEDIFVYEDALRHGKSIVIAHVADDQEDRAREIIENAGAEDIDTLRDHWWTELRDEERAYYHKDGRDFDRDETTYRQGFEAAQHPRRRGKAYTDVEDDLRTAYGPELDTCFREGYERGSVYCSKRGERRTD